MLFLLLLFAVCFQTETVSVGLQSPADTRQIILDKALESLQANYDEEYFRFELSARWIPGSLLNADPKNIQRIELKGAISQYTNFEVTYVRRNEIRSKEIQLKVDAQQKLPVSNHRIISGEVLETRDFDLRWVPIVVGRDHLVQDINELAGKTLKKTLNAGEAVSPSVISSGFLVKAGDEVDLIYIEYGIQIVLGCEARQNGSKGEDIQIYCKETRNKYLGRIERPGVAQWQKTQ